MIAEEDDQMVRNNSITSQNLDKDDDNRANRCCKVCFAECLRQGRLGIWQFPLQMFLPLFLFLIYVGQVGYLWN